MDEENKKIKKMEEKLKMNKIWIQEQNTLPEGMVERIYSNKRLMKNYVDLLNEEEKTDKNKEKIYKYKKKEYKRSLSSNIIEGVSPTARNILIKIGKHIKKMKNSISDITKMNGLYLEPTVRNTMRLQNRQKNKTLSKFNYKNVQLDHILNDDDNENYNKTFLNKHKESDIKNILSDNGDIYGEKHKKGD